MFCTINLNEIMTSFTRFEPYDLYKSTNNKDLNMEIEFTKRKRYGNSMYVRIPLFENKLNKKCCLFCGQPYMYLVVHQTLADGFICMFGIGDNDDFDYYVTLKNKTPEQIHEIVNWMKDHKYAEIRSYSDVEDFVSGFCSDSSF